MNCPNPTITVVMTIVTHPQEQDIIHGVEENGDRTIGGRETWTLWEKVKEPLRAEAKAEVTRAEEKAMVNDLMETAIIVVPMVIKQLTAAKQEKQEEAKEVKGVKEVKAKD